MGQRKIILDSVIYTTELGLLGLVRKARMVFRVFKKDGIHTFTLPLTFVVDDKVSENDMIDYAIAELREVIIQLRCAKP